MLQDKYAAIETATQALGLYGVLENNDWWKKLDETYLTAAQREQVRDTVYVTLVSLADRHIRWLQGAQDKNADDRCLELRPRVLGVADGVEAIGNLARLVRRAIACCEGGPELGLIGVGRLVQVDVHEHAVA